MQYMHEPNEKFGTGELYSTEREECKMGMGLLLVSEPKSIGRGVVTAPYAMTYTPPPC